MRTKKHAHTALRTRAASDAVPAWLFSFLSSFLCRGGWKVDEESERRADEAGLGFKTERGDRAAVTRSPPRQSCMRMRPHVRARARTHAHARTHTRIRTSAQSYGRAPLHATAYRMKREFIACLDGSKRCISSPHFKYSS
eukprot:5566329-Pleurochrysis_carterae.AAC.1